MRRTVVLLAALTGLPLAAAAAQEEEKPKIRRNPDVISAEEIAARPDLQTALDAVQRLRSSWLRIRGRGSPTADPAPIVVYVDGIRMGGIEMLRNYPARQIQEMRRMNAADATTRYGTDHSSGAIIVTTARIGPPPGA